MTDKELFYQRIEDEYEDYLDRIDEYDGKELYNEAETIADMKEIYNYLIHDEEYLVPQFYNDLHDPKREEKKANRIQDLAELLIKEANWVGFPTPALKWLPWILNPKCLIFKEQCQKLKTSNLLTWCFSARNPPI